MQNLFNMTRGYTGDPLTRKTDPATSHQAASTAVSAETVTDVVRWIMSVGIPRIDEEIYNTGVAMGRQFAAPSYRRGRAALVRSGYLKPTGKTRLTYHGSQAREWVKV